MQVNIIIIPDNEEAIYMHITTNYIDNLYTYTLFFPSTKNYLDFIKSKKIYISDFEEYNKDHLDYLKNNLDEFTKQVANTMPIYILFDLESIDIIDNVILDISNLSWNDKLLIINNIATENTYFMDKYTVNEVISLEEIKCIYQIITDIASNLLNKSPLEQIYSIYNLLKERPYLREQENESTLVSRSLNHILYTEPIVCIGYCNFFMAICDALGINTSTIKWKNEESHASNMCFINDSKYNIVGIFAMDITWDNTKYDTLKNFLNPLLIEETIKKINGFTIKDSHNIFYSLVSDYQEYNHLENESDILNKRKIIIDKINEIYSLLKINKKIEFICDIDKEVWEIFKLSYVIISPYILKSIINSDNKLDDETCLELIQTSFHYQTLPNESKLLTNKFLRTKER